MGVMADVSDEVLRLTRLFHTREWREALEWKPFREGVDIYRLYWHASGPRAALLRFHPGGRVPLHEHMGYEHILILEGSQEDERGQAEAGTFVINPPGTRHTVFSKNGCVVLAIYEKPVRFVESASAS